MLHEHKSKSGQRGNYIMANRDIRIGVLATLIGPFATMGQDALRGLNLALDEVDRKIGDRAIRVFTESTNAIPESAISQLEKLIDHNRVDLTIGPLSGNELLAVREIAAEMPDRVFVNGCAGAPDVMLPNTPQNFFSFSANGVQLIAGLGTYVYETLGIRRVVTLAEDYSYPYSQVGGFVLDFCRAGGTIIDKLWVPLGTSDFRDIIQNLPQESDAIFVALAGADAVEFFHQLEDFDIQIPLITGSSTLDPSVLSSIASLPKIALGIRSANSVAADIPTPAWNSFLNAYRETYPDGLAYPSLFALGYYQNTKAVILALQAIDGDIENRYDDLREVLANLEFESPTGPIRLDEYNQVIANNFVTQLEISEDGHYFSHVVRAFPGISQTLGLHIDDYLALGPFSRDNPPCL
jgi:branched-chain amino acid transport system substrate-binding protein